MKRGKLGLAAIALAIAAAGMSPAHSIPNPCTAQSIAGHGYLWCGYHWASWPVTYTIDTPPSGKVPGVPLATYKSAVMSAANTWNSGWAMVSGGAAAPLVYTASPTSTTVHVAWTSLPTDKPGRTITNGTGMIIQSATVYLNDTLTYGIATMPAELAGGELASPTAGAIPGDKGTVHACIGMMVDGTGHTDCSWYDVQDVLTHEFGHLIGLEHPGDEAHCWPAALTNADDMNETMYACTYPAETSKRDLHWGDIVGLSKVGRATTGQGPNLPI